MDHCTKFTLQRLCRRRGWRGYSRLTKANLLHFILCHQASIKIQRWYRKLNTQVPVNDTDFYTLEPFDHPELVFRFRQDGVLFLFDVSSILKYFLASGKTDNPYTRRPIMDKDILGFYARYKHSSVTIEFTSRGETLALAKYINILSLIKSIRRLRIQELENQQTLTFLENECYQIHTTIIDMIHAQVAPQQEVRLYQFTIMDLCTVYMPVSYRRLCDLYAYNSLRARELRCEFLQECQAVNNVSENHKDAILPYITLLREIF
jgi:hypothetical protein